MPSYPNATDVPPTSTICEDLALPNRHAPLTQRKCLGHIECCYAVSLHSLRGGVVGLCAWSFISSPQPSATFIAQIMTLDITWVSVSFIRLPTHDVLESLNSY